MLLQVREQVLDVWSALVAYSYPHKEWQWEGRAGSNSISDAEQLLCLLYPATNVPALRIDNPDETAPDVLAALRGLGDDIDVVRILTEILITYMTKYRLDDGTPDFSGGTYFEPFEQDGGADTSAEQRRVPVVDSFSMSITLCLSALAFVQGLRGKVRSRTLVHQLDDLERLTSERLSAAMVGLLRSFSVKVFDIDSAPGQTLCAMANQRGEPERLVAERLARSLNQVRASLREELSIGSGQVGEELDNPLRLFECGWAWSIVQEAPEIPYASPVGKQPPGVAEDKPMLYFTGVALDGIEDLFSERTRILGLLNDEQQRLTTALQLRWDLCMGYWTKVATFGTGRWPLEDLPWRTTDGVESDHFSLLVASIVAQNMHVHRETSRRTARLGAVLEELANRGRITRRPVRDDPAMAVHLPGTRLPLGGSEQLGQLQAWTVSSYSSLLLKRVLQLTSRVQHTRERDRLFDLADQTWDHLQRRRLSERRGAGLWDQPGGAWMIELDGRTREQQQGPSWYHTQRICECLVAAAGTLTRGGPVSAELVELAGEYLSEAEYLFDQEQLYGTWAVDRRVIERGSETPAQAIMARLERARTLQYWRPGTAIVLAQDVLRDLEEVAKPRTQPLIGDFQ
jgi:hypothetical protein